eukprot:COSAG02_NODE_123_length_35269_cov_51.697526_20_plen_52_part_00
MNGLLGGVGGVGAQWNQVCLPGCRSASASLYMPHATPVPHAVLHTMHDVVL